MKKKMEYALDGKFCFGQGKKTENVVFLLLTSKHTVLFCLWLFVNPEPGVFGSLEPKPEPLEKKQVPEPCI